MNRLLPGVLLAVVLSACADLSMEPGRIPSSIVLEHDTVTLTEGTSTTIGVIVLDQHGEELEVPGWAAPEWSTSSTTVFGSEGQTLNALAPGQALATVEVAGLSATSLFRVNPAQITVSIDSVKLYQSSTAVSVLVEGQEAKVRVFLHADNPNFFEPSVAVNVVRDGEVIGTVALSSEATSIPHQPSVKTDWSGILPAAMVQDGNALEVLVDPAGELPHASGSDRRHPAEGYMAMRFAVTIEIGSVLLTQSIQRADGSVPLVGGRDALLRIFVTSAEEVAIRPVVRATFFRGGSEIGSFDVRRTLLSLPKAGDRSSLRASWNVRVPGSLLTPGTSVVIDADPEGELVLTPESVVRYPATGQHALNIQEVPPLWVRMIPVHQTAFGTTGEISAANLNAYSEEVIEKFPVAAADIDLRTTYTTDARLDTFDGWLQLLSEIAALRDVDGSGRYYYGVLTHPGTDGMPGGLGYLGYPAAIGYDFMPYGAETFAHELGHNFDLPHAPCGGPDGADPDFPYSGGGIGEWGYDISGGDLIDPSDMKDLMSYCDPVWISDYNYLKVLAYRDYWDWTASGPDELHEEEPSLLIWGGVRNGELVLEPAFELEMRPDIPSEAGPYRIEGLNAAGNLLFTYSFSPKQIDHSDGDSSFSFAIPTRFANTGELTELRVVGPEGVATRRSRADRPVAGGPVVSHDRSNRRSTLSWTTDAYPMALIRDASTGEVLSFARGGQAKLAIPLHEVDVLLSDGVRSVRPTVR